jgi:hypothetical protein
VKIVNDNYLYAKTAKFIGNRKEFTKEKLDGLEEVVMDTRSWFCDLFLIRFLLMLSSQTSNFKK